MKDVDIKMSLDRAESTSLLLKLSLFSNVQDTCTDVHFIVHLFYGLFGVDDCEYRVLCLKMSDALSQSVRSADSLDSFKRKLKFYLFNSCFNV